MVSMFTAPGCFHEDPPHEPRSPLHPLPHHQLGCNEALYVHLMLNQHRGYPLSHPSLNMALPVAHLRRGISIGDVGFIGDSGLFDFLFNIYLPADHPINDGECNVPTNFSPLDEPEILEYEYPPGSHLANGFEEMTTSSPEFTDALSFRSTSMFGAICGLPCGSTVKKLSDLEKIRQHAMSCGPSWYHYAIYKKRRIVINGSLYLITGTEKSDSWGIATVRQLVQGGSCMHLMRGKSHDHNSQCYWVHSMSHTGEWANYPNDTDFHGRRNQTLFVHGFKIGLGSQAWRTATMGRRSILKNHGLRTSWIARLFSWMPKWLVSILWYWSPWFAEAYIRPFLRASRFYAPFVHPSLMLAEYLLGRVPEADSVVVHDDDWAALLRDVRRPPIHLMIQLH
ncbi:hypothetical protein DFH06DRAFT_286032 [Mycena polygramma]|nr:hypothetical protein DFH06DRAFT_286032 [Mycena polygramma]